MFKHSLSTNGLLRSKTLSIHYSFYRIKIRKPFTHNLWANNINQGWAGYMFQDVPKIWLPKTCLARLIQLLLRKHFGYRYKKKKKTLEPGSTLSYSAILYLNSFNCFPFIILWVLFYNPYTISIWESKILLILNWSLVIVLLRGKVVRRDDRIWTMIFCLYPEQTHCQAALHYFQLANNVIVENSCLGFHVLISK